MVCFAIDYVFLLSHGSRLYDFHPQGQEDMLIETMELLKWTGDPWEDVFEEQAS